MEKLLIVSFVFFIGCASNYQIYKNERDLLEVKSKYDGNFMAIQNYLNNYETRLKVLEAYRTAEQNLRNPPVPISSSSNYGIQPAKEK